MTTLAHQEVINDAEGRHQQLHVLLTMPQRGATPPAEQVVLYQEDQKLSMATSQHWTNSILNMVFCKAGHSDVA